MARIGNTKRVFVREKTVNEYIDLYMVERGSRLLSFGGNKFHIAPMQSAFAPRGDPL